MTIWAADVCSRAARQLICIEPAGLRLRHIGKTDPQCGTVQFCFHSGRLTCSARTGFRAVTTPLHGSHIRQGRLSPAAVAALWQQFVAAVVTVTAIVIVVCGVAYLAYVICIIKSLVFIWLITSL